MEHISPREWGRRQAAVAPVWSESKWRRIGAILDIEFVPNEAAEHDGEPVEPGDASGANLGLAA